MINRILIRIKVLQIVYSYYQTENKDLKAAESELLFSLRKSYDLYHYFLLLIVELTNLQRRIIDTKKNKFMPSQEELNPNTKFIDNRFAMQVAQNLQLQKYCSEHAIVWEADDNFVKSLLDTILTSDIYAEYLASEDNSFENDREFWRKVFKQFICNNEFVTDYLEDKSIYWNDDIEIVQTFVLKTIKKFEEEKGADFELLPMFRDIEDHQFAVKLFRQSIVKGSDYKERINKHIKNWEAERIATMDLVIMQVAIAELISFPSIPISVTFNEYIDSAKHYSTPKSSTFINGILDTVVKELKNENLLFKN